MRRKAKHVRKSRQAAGNFRRQQTQQHKTEQIAQPQPEPAILWHFTVGRKYEDIIAQGELRPKAGKMAGEGKPTLWCTVSDKWDETANKMTTILVDGEPTLIHLSAELTHFLLGGLVRIGVLPESAPYSWTDYKRLSGVSSSMARSLYKIAIKKGSRPANWRVTFDAIPKSEWLSVEFWTGTEWSTDPGVMPEDPPMEVGLEWIMEGLKSDEVTPASSVRSVQGLGANL